MLSCSRRDSVAIVDAPRSRRITLPPSGSGSPAGAIGPPLAEIDDLLQALVRVGQLAFVNQQTRFDLAVPHLVLNLIERHHDVLDTPDRRDAAPETRSSTRRGPRREPLPATSGRCCFETTIGTVAIAHAGAMGQQQVAIGQVRVGMKRDRRDLVVPLERRRGSTSRYPPGRARSRTPATAPARSRGRRT